MFVNFLSLMLCHQKLYVCIIVIIFMYPLQAKDAARDGDIVSARKSAQNALYCNIASIVCAVIAYISLVVIIPVAIVAVGAVARAANGPN